MSKIRLIDGNALGKYISDWQLSVSGSANKEYVYDTLGDVWDAVYSAPTITPEMLRTESEWKLNPRRFSCEHFRCKQCHFISCIASNYCGCCGAAMKNAGVKPEDLPIPTEEV